MKRLVLSASIVAALIPAAHAADLVYADVVAPVYETVAYDWTGFYAGVIGGFGTGTVSLEEATTPLDDTVTTTGALVGVTLGANAQYDEFVLGIEGDVSWSNLSGTTADCGGVVGVDCSASIDWLGSLRARAGFAADRALIYVTGGVAFAGLSAEIDPPVAPATGTFSDTYLGWTVGGGVEIAVTDDISVKAEYNYYDFGTQTAAVDTLLPAVETDVSATAHIFKLGANFQF